MSAPEVQFVAPPHPASLVPGEFLKGCEVTTGRTGGPGGQHRNKVDTAVTIVHTATGVRVTASERRSQAQNRTRAIYRLRRKLAVVARTRVDRDRYRPTAPWCQRRQGKGLPINPHHKDYPALLAEALDVVMARGCDVAGAAGILGVTMSQLAKLIRHDKAAFGAVNGGREQRGLPKLKG